ncbi:MAG: hypothetical protein ACR2P2_17370 [Nakamurella sp.]
MTATRRRVLPDEKFRRTGAESVGPNWLPDALGAAAQFRDAVNISFPEDLTIPAADFVGHLSTLSGYLQLAPTVRAEVLRRIEAALPPEVDVHRELGVHLARRLPDPDER